MARKPANAHYFKSSEYRRVMAVERDHLGLSSKEPIIGLALSGGGIRSASFALGLLQALYSFGVFDKFNYLSTVSGGGYIGGALTYFRNVLRPGKAWFPFGYEPPQGANKVKAMGARTVAKADPDNELARKVVTYLRQHASYMTPSQQVGGPALAAGVLRGLVSTLLPYFAILSGLFGLLAWAGFFDSHSGWQRLVRTDAPVPAVTGDAATPACPGDPCSALAKCLAVPCPAGQTCQTGCVVLAACPAESCEKKTETHLPAFYLAFAPAGIAAVIGVILVMAFIFSSILAGLNQSRGHAEKDPVRGYRGLIRFYGTSGTFVVAGLILLGLSTLPWVHAYLGGLWQAALGPSKDGDSGLPANFSALFAAIGGALGLIARLRSVMGGEATKPSSLHAIGMAAAGIFFLYGVLLLAYGTSIELYDAKSILQIDPGKPRLLFDCAAWIALWPSLWPVVLPSLATLALGIVVALLVHINLATPHRIYRDRLMEIFCAEETALETGEWAPAATAQSAAGWLVNMKREPKPYHLINTCLVTTDSQKRRYRGRGGDNFVFSPLFFGSDATGWVKAEVGMNQLSLPTAVAISGAALNAHAGPHGSGLLRNKAYSALLSLLGLNLGFWMQNPLRFKRTTNPGFYIPTLLRPGLRALFGRKLHEKGAYVQLSDGGHFENLAIYELIRRKVKFLWISDAGQDSGFSFEDLANAIERVRVDFGVNLRFQDDDYDLSHVIPGSATSDNPAGENFVERYNLATRGYAIGKIEYPDEVVNGVVEKREGVVVYVKSTLTRGLPGDLYGYKARNEEYPHQTTLDQFFDEDQFEAYRELGYRLAARLFRDIGDHTKPGYPPLPKSLQAVADLLDFKPSSA